MIDTIVQRWVDERPDQPAIIGADGTLTWAQVRAQAGELARQLDALDPAPPAMLMLHPRAASLSALVGAALARRPVILVSHLLEAVAREYLEAVGGSCLLEIRDGRIEVALRSTRPPAPLPARDGETEFYIFTSGSTGKPKCARHTWSTLAKGAKVIPRLLGRRWLIAHSIAQFGGLQILTYCLLNGSTTVLPGDYTPQTALRTVRDHGVEYIDSTPTYLRQLLMNSTRSDWEGSKLYHVSLAGEIVSQQLIDAIKEMVPGVKITHVYSSTEMGSSIRVTDGREGFDAKLIDHQHLKIVDGELHVRRSSKAMLGYLGNAPLEQEWVATNDLVEVVGDRVRFLGRADDVINVGGSKVIPGVVEGVIRQVAGVADVRVSGHASSIVGNLVKATLLLVPGAARDQVVEQVKRHCTAHLAAHMVPRVVVVADQLQLTVTQKWSRREKPA
jgi:acyl-coenzyme A synthetase/AMP-(fatty) acid ligase